MSVGVVHVKFWSALKWEALMFDGHSITAREVKQLIVVKKSLLSVDDRLDELVMSDPNGDPSKPYDDAANIPGGSRVLVRRLPLRSPYSILTAATPAPAPGAAAGWCAACRRCIP
jgi:hypothetical protein